MVLVVTPVTENVVMNVPIALTGGGYMAVVTMGGDSNGDGVATAAVMCVLRYMCRS